MGKGDLRRAVIERDRQCIAALLDLSHECKDKWGRPHNARDMNRLTLEHIVDRRGRRLDEPLWCIALCSEGNVVQHWSNANRDVAWAYLEGIRTALGQR